ncbi:MAG: zinc ribbon domain-containing protein YjdM [Trueperaceae bacterium]
MSETAPVCPECGSEHTYEVAPLLACAMCGHEWNPEELAEQEAASGEVRDAVGNLLADGDAVIVMRDLKVKGAAQALKAGTKVTNIKLVEPIDDHDIDCRVDGFGRMRLMSSVVKKA